MVFKKTWNGTRKKELPNRMRKKVTVNFRCDRDNYLFLKKLIIVKKGAEFINRAVSMRIYYETNHTKLLYELILEDPYYARNILRKAMRIHKMIEEEDKSLT